MGDRGRVVIPAALREQRHLDEGTPLVIVDTPKGMLLVTRSELQQLVADDLAGLDLVDDLLRERRDAHAAES